MNDPNKVIDVNISSLLSLKAELLRKQEEVSKAKAKQAAEPFIPTRKSTKSDKNNKIKKSEKIECNENTNNYEEYEDSALLDKSRKVLEAKSRFYDKMAASGGTLNSDDNCLVLFNQKKQDSKPERRESTDSKNSNDSDDHYDEDDDDDAHNADEEWVEYTDCLGRTRKCLKKDLEFFKKKDTQLAENIQPRIELNQNAPMWMIDTKGSNNEAENETRDNMSEMTSVVSKHDQMKMNWEKKEEENIYKENVHYQDVLFDEARQHGVGYYAFSTDEEERAKQRKALDELREKTLAEQKQREAQRIHREKIIAERVKAAKNRQRARLGLPPLEDEPEPISEKLYDTKEEEKKKKKEEKEKRKKEKQEKLKEEERKKHIRPWDKSKDGVKITKDRKYLSDSEEEVNNEEWKYKPEREPMSQEQWNEMKRNERNTEFAPLPEEIPIRSFRSQMTTSSSDYSLDTTTMKTGTLYFTTKKSQQQNKKNKINKEFVKRNYSSINDDEKVRIPIRNELNDDDDDDVYDKNSSKRSGSSGGSGVEIPPPPTYEYYGPSVTKRSKLSKKPDLEQSIEAGLRFIRDKSDKGILPVKSSWTANASNADC